MQPDPPTCATCGQDRFWCQTCAARGHWACECDHPRQALSLTARVPAWLIQGQEVRWSSPLFGDVTGRFLESMGARQVKVYNPVTESETVIPASWLTEELKESA